MPYTNQVAQVGAREDLSDILAVADAKQMPFMSKLPKGEIELERRGAAAIGARATASATRAA